MAGLRLNLPSGMTRYSPLDPIPSASRGNSASNTSSAAMAQAQRKIKKLEEENETLREELKEVKSVNMHLIREGKQENFDERRVNFLKAQMVQLEKQIMLLTEALESRSEVLLEVENAVTAISQECREKLNNKERIGSVTMSKDDLTKIIETAESARLKLGKCVERTCANENLQRHLVFSSPCLKQPKESVTLWDVCSGNLHHLNLRHIAKLESQLAQVYKKLTSLNECCAIVAAISRRSNETSRTNNDISSDVSSAVYIRLGGIASKLQIDLQKVLVDLLDLSVLIPAAPWPVLKRPIAKEITVDNIMIKLPAMSKSKTEEAQKTIESLVKAYNYQYHMYNLNTKSMREELNFQQSLYQLQVDYTMELMDVLKDSYQNFEVEVNSLICDPLRDILRKYTCLKKTASDDALKYFLEAFKENEVALVNAVEQLTPQEDFDKENQLSAFGADFLVSLEKQRKICAEKRDRFVIELEDVKCDNKEHVENMKALFKSDVDNQDENMTLESARDENQIKEENERNESPLTTKNAVKKKKNSRIAQPKLEKSNTDVSIESGCESKTSNDESQTVNPPWNFDTQVSRSDEFGKRLEEDINKETSDSTAYATTRDESMFDDENSWNTSQIDENSKRKTERKSTKVSSDNSSIKPKTPKTQMSSIPKARPVQKSKSYPIKPPWGQW